MKRDPINELQKADFCDLLRNGKLRFDACRQLDLTVDQIRNAYRNDPNFRREVDDALLEATEPVENALYTAAKEGQPWAVKEWLQKRDKERWGPTEQKITVTHELEGHELIEGVGTLISKLEERRAAQGAIPQHVIDAASIEVPRPLGITGTVIIPNPVKVKMAEMRKARRAAGLPMSVKGVAKMTPEELNLDTRRISRGE